jgi:hypothetical protein
VNQFAAANAFHIHTKVKNASPKAIRFAFPGAMESPAATKQATAMRKKIPCTDELMVVIANITSVSISTAATAPAVATAGEEQYDHDDQNNGEHDVFLS